MAIGRTFNEALQKALRSLEAGRGSGFDWTARPPRPRCDDELRAMRRVAARGRLRRRAAGLPARRCHRAAARARPASTRGSSTRSRCSTSSRPRSRRARELDRDLLRRAKRHGFSDARIGATVRHAPRTTCAASRHALGIRPVYKMVDTCAAEFAALHALPLLDLRGGDESRPAREQGHDPGQRAQPHRPGHRVRLLVRARRLRAPGRRASRPSWSTATRRPSPPTTTPPTASTSSR